jgi:trimethylamine:corrinoid methyltransferase-like protein
LAHFYTNSGQPPYKDLDKQEKALEGNLKDIQSKQELDKTFNNIDKQLDHEQKIERNMKTELTKDIKQNLDKEVDRTIEKAIEDVLEHELTRDRGLGR